MFLMFHTPQQVISKSQSCHALEVIQVGVHVPWAVTQMSCLILVDVMLVFKESSPSLGVQAEKPDRTLYASTSLALILVRNALRA